MCGCDRLRQCEYRRARCPRPRPGAHERLPRRCWPVMRDATVAQDFDQMEHTSTNSHVSHPDHRNSSLALGQGRRRVQTVQDRPGRRRPGEDKARRCPMATLLSLNVGMPKDVSWRGRTVHTGVWKSPVDGSRMVRRLNIDGDGQGDVAGHGGEQRAVLVYQVESYRHWEEFLGRDDLERGAFGENFTVEGLADDEVCIGDRLRIGEAEFEVTQPRVTCFRVGMRMGEPRLPSLLVAHHRPGFYLRVLTEGHVSAGDEIVRTARGPNAVTVAEVDALLYLPGHDRDRLRAALDIPALSPGWQESFRSMLEGGGFQPAGVPLATTPAWAGFRTLTVTEVVAESDTVTSFRMSAEEALPAYLAGQFLTVRVRGAGDPVPVRTYSLSGDPAGGSYRISVKGEALGLVSAYLRTHLQHGDRIEVAAPRG